MATLPPPRKKPRVQEEAGTPLPVPVASVTGLPASDSNWLYYKALYENGVILVSDPDHSYSLWQNGYYGYDRRDPSSSDNAKNTCKFHRKKNWKLLSTKDLQPRSYFTSDTFPVQKFQSGESHACQELDGDKEVDNSVLNLGKGRDATQYRSDSYNPFETVLDLSCHHGEGDIRSLNAREAPEGSMKLMPEEAMFLSYALGCLVVTREQSQSTNYHINQGSVKKHTEGNDMTLDSMWTEFTKADKTFPIKYAVYHHYRSRGWVVKCGLKFGADWVLYPVGPPFYHAQYTVMIQCVWSDTLLRDNTLSWREFSWTNIAATERLNSHVAKAPLICFVMRPRGLTEGKLNKVECLRELTVQELLLSRWLPNAQDPDKES